MNSVLPVAALAALGLAAAAPEPSGPGRAIVVEATVAAPPADVFRLWTTGEGVRNFFAPGARIDRRAGGRYEIVFNPAADPEVARARREQRSCDTSRTGASTSNGASAFPTSRGTSSRPTSRPASS